MTVVQFLEELRRLDVHVEADGDRLRVSAPVGALTVDYRRELRERKPEIVDFLSTVRQLKGQKRAIVPLKPTGVRPPIFAVPGHTGDVFMYWNLVPHLAVEQPLYALQPPGLQEGSEPLADVRELAAYFAGEIRGFRAEGPITIAGYCAGGAIAFELARQLSESGREVKQLILLGTAYSAVYRLLPVANAFLRLVRLARVLAAVPLTRWRRHFMGRIRTRRIAGNRIRHDPVLVRRTAVSKAMLSAVRHYRPRAFNGHVSLMLPPGSLKWPLTAPQRWCRRAASSAEFIGPDGCNSDSMLLPQYVPAFAEFINNTCDPRRRAPVMEH